jgi:hypothetical protein
MMQQQFQVYSTLLQQQMTCAGLCTGLQCNHRTRRTLVEMGGRLQDPSIFCSAAKRGQQSRINSTSILFTLPISYEALNPHTLACRCVSLAMLSAGPSGFLTRLHRLHPHACSSPIQLLSLCTVLYLVST